MLSINDFKEKQILIIQSTNKLETKIKFQNDNLIYTKNDKVVDKISCYKLLAIFVQGDLSFTTVLIKKLLNYGASIFFLKDNFETYATIGSQAAGNYLLRMDQYARKDDLFIAGKIVQNKLLNQLILLKNSKKISVSEYQKAKRKVIDDIKVIKSNKELLGIEGSAAKFFFSLYFKKIGWRRRMPRTKYDIPNLLMDIGYTYIFNYVDTLLRLYGFDTYKGFYHKLFFQRKSLSCDLVEPFRCIIDKQILKSYNLKQINENDFQLKKGRYFLPYNNNHKYTKIFAGAINGYKEEIFCYIREFYKFIQGNKKFPQFKIK